MHMQHIAKMLDQVQVSKGQAPPALKPLEIGATTELAKALADKKLPAAGAPALMGTLKYIFMLIGLRPVNFPQGIEIDFLVQYILKNFAGHTNQEIRLAFDLAVAGRLSLDLRDVNCYENFSVAYFARIMQAYIAWARETYTLLPDKRPLKTRTAEEEAVWRLDLNLGFALYLLKQVNKFPCKLKMNRHENKEDGEHERGGVPEVPPKDHTGSG